MEKKSMDRKVHFLKRGDVFDRRTKTGISMHCHSLHSKELLDFVPHYATRIPVVRHFWAREMRRRELLYAELPDFRSGFWSPPLTPHEVLESELSSIESFGLKPIVSITDHDGIDANIELRETAAAHDLPISMEWTVPFEQAYFHIGVHNLPADRAAEITGQLLAYTYAEGYPDDPRLTELFAILNAQSEVLIVFNHPIWDIETIGQEAHERALKRFLELHKQWLHALEINGFRAWAENQLVIDLASELNMPVVTGGDRHCCRPNTMFNITDAQTFSEFVQEVRIDGHSEMAVTPEYHTTLPWRQLASMSEILGDYPHFPSGRQLWSDRIFLDAHDGNGLRSLTDHWSGRRPAWAQMAVGMLRVLAHPIMQPILAATVGDTDIGREERGVEPRLRAPSGVVRSAEI